MTEPIKKGDLAIIMRGYRDPSPNIGKIVTVGRIALDHPLFGPMREVSGADLVVENRPNSDRCNIPVSWLKKIEPPKPKSPEVKKELAHDC